MAEDFAGHVAAMLQHSALETILGLAVLVSTLFTVFLVTLPSQYNRPKDRPAKESPPRPGAEDEKEKSQDGKEKGKELEWKAGKTVHVVVLGDIGRSPRMQYHAISLAKHGARVFLFGYKDSEIHPEILSNSLIRIVPLTPAPSILRPSRKILFLVLAPLKALWQAFSLYHALCYRAPPARWMLVQNPPSIPTLAISTLVCLFRQTSLIIDWHNFGYTILALKLGPRHPLVLISSLYENAFARLATHHFTVTYAMSRVLSTKYNIKPLTLHDRPASLFRPISASQKLAFLSRLPETAQYAQALTSASPNPKWKLIVSPTSWTPDEDFALLLDALSAYSAQATSSPHLPSILAIITGKGPQQAHYLSKIAALNAQNKLANVRIVTAWLTPTDYALLLASADLGVSLHTSSSGVDLPMKVVDMFGTGLPVVGWSRFEAWPELVKEDVNGKGFGSSDKLWRLLVNLFEDREGQGVLGTLKDGAMVESTRRWDREWDCVAGRLFELV